MQRNRMTEYFAELEGAAPDFVEPWDAAFGPPFSDTPIPPTGFNSCSFSSSGPSHSFFYFEGRCYDGNGREIPFTDDDNGESDGFGHFPSPPLF
jgi:hypothetical protein